MYRRSSQGWLKHFDFIIIDLFCVQLTFFVTAFLRHGGLPYYDRVYTYTAVWLFLVDILISILFSSYAGVLKRGYLQELKATVLHTSEVALGVLVILYLLQDAGYLSRMVFVSFWILYTAVSYLCRIQWKRYVQKHLSEKGIRSFVIVTSSDLAEQVVKRIKGNNYYGLKLTGVILMDQSMTGWSYEGVPVVADAETAEEYLCREWVDEVFFNLPEEIELPTELINLCEEMGLTVHLRMAKIEDFQNTNRFVQKLAGYMVITSSVNVLSGGQVILKRLMDIAGGVVGCILTGILFLFVAPAIYLKSPGPIFFSQWRIGKNGRKFKIYKFRSMYMNAEEQKKKLMEQNKIKGGMMFKMDDDPRIIKGIGHFIRKTSIDEFPQFLNVLKGDMSMVGTRPPTLDEWEKYSPRHRIRMATKPGLTGMWQVSGRSNITDFDEVVRLDEKYIREWSFGLDIRIIFKTIGNMISGDGAE